MYIGRPLGAHSARAPVCTTRLDTSNDAVDLCVMEVKFAMGAEIGDVANQLRRYHNILCDDLIQVAADAQALLRDKIDLGLFGTNKRLEKLKQLKVSDQIEDVRSLVILAEQNPYSKSLDLSSLSSVPFKKIEIFRVWPLVLRRLHARERQMAAPR
jgi:hypothetical protein